jgi:hypothetical protein
MNLPCVQLDEAQRTERFIEETQRKKFLPEAAKNLLQWALVLMYIPFHR